MSLSDPVGMRAVQSLSFDIANLTSRLAMLGALVTQLVEQTGQIDTSLWNYQKVEDDGASGYEMVTMPGTEADKLTALLTLIRSIN